MLKGEQVCPKCGKCFSAKFTVCPWCGLNLSDEQEVVRARNEKKPVGKPLIKHLRNIRVQTGKYRIGKEGAIRLSRSATLIFSKGSNSVYLNAKYDPPGTCLYTCLAHFITVAVILILLFSAGVAIGGPGLLLWYIMILMLRRRKVQIRLNNAKQIVIDHKRQAFAFLTWVEGRDGWIGFRSKKNFDKFNNVIKELRPEITTEGKVSDPEETVKDYVKIGLLIAAALFILLLLTGIIPVGRR